MPGFRAALSAIQDAPGAPAPTEQHVILQLQQGEGGTPTLRIADEQGALVNQLALCASQVGALYVMGSRNTCMHACTQASPAGGSGRVAAAHFLLIEPPP